MQQPRTGTILITNSLRHHTAVRMPRPNMSLGDSGQCAHYAVLSPSLLRVDVPAVEVEVTGGRQYTPR